MTTWKGADLHEQRDEKGLACRLGLKSRRLCLFVAVSFNWIKRLPRGYRLDDTGKDLWRLSSLPSPPAQSRITHSRLLRNLSSQALNVSETGDFTASLGNLFQSSTARTVGKVLCWDGVSCISVSATTVVYINIFKSTLYSHRCCGVGDIHFCDHTHHPELYSTAFQPRNATCLLHLSSLPLC